MKHIIRIKMALVLLFTASLTYGQQNNNHLIRFSGKMTDTKKEDQYYLYILYSAYDWFGPMGNEIQKVEIDSAGHFEFNIPDLNKPYKINIVIKGVHDSVSQSLWSEEYYVKPNDDIKIKIDLNRLDLNRSTVFFSGEGSEKYNLVAELDQQYYEYMTKKLPLIGIGNGFVKNPDELSLKMEGLAKILKQCITVKNTLVNNAKITSEIKSIINHEFAMYPNEWVFRTELIYKANQNFRNQIAANYLKYNKEFFDKPDQLSTLCPEYLLRLSSTEILEEALSSKTDRANLIAVYNSVKTNYSGALKDRLLANCFFSNYIKRRFELYSDQTRDSLLNDAVEVVSVPYIKTALNNQVKASQKVKSQTKIYNGQFIGVNGNFDLKSLNGKVIFIDLWFNGCVPCAEFHKTFEKNIYPKFKDNKDFVALSLSMDATKERWIKGIESNLYTSKEYINAWTGPLVTEHPFMKYYGIKGTPFLMIVDRKGNVFYKPETTTIEDLSSQIKQALNN